MRLCLWLLSPSIMFSRFIHVVACVRASVLFYGWVIFHSLDGLHFYSLIHRWRFRLLPFGNYEQCCCANVCTRFVWRPVFNSFGLIPRSGKAVSHGNSANLEESCSVLTLAGLSLDSPCPRGHACCPLYPELPAREDSYTAPASQPWSSSSTHWPWW